MMDASPLLQIRNLKVVLGGATIIDLPELDILRGEVLVVLGPNGAGKSTLLLTAARLLKPAGGSVTLVESPRLTELEYRRRVATVFQAPLLLDETVYQNAAAGLRFRGIPKKLVSQRVGLWLDRLHIRHLENRQARTLSGGEAQRVSLVRAFCLETDLILLDEPFSALDAPTRLELLDELRGLFAETNQTCIYVTHDLDEALALGDRVAVFFNGHLHQIGTPEDVFTKPTTQEMAAFVGVETIIPGTVIAQKEELVQIAADGITIEAIDDIPIGSPVFACMRPEDITIYRMENIPASSSARNRLIGTITRLVNQGPLMRVQLDAGFPVSILITRSSALEMGLVSGMQVTAVFKSSAIHVIRGNTG